MANLAMLLYRLVDLEDGQDLTAWTVRVINAVKAGDEITVSYGDGFSFSEGACGYQECSPVTEGASKPAETSKPSDPDTVVEGDRVAKRKKSRRAKKKPRVD